MGPRVTYLAMDSVAEGIGYSQVFAYALALAREGVELRLHTFEKTTPDPRLRRQLQEAGVAWVAHRFGRFGTAGGIGRVLRGAAAVRGAELVHARSDMAAASAMLARVPRFVWDVRALWVDQRLELGTMRRGSPQERVFRWVERQAARRSAAIVTLTSAVVPELEARHGAGIAGKVTVVPTCVDTERFSLAALPASPPLRILLSGTVNAYYDVAAMAALVATLRIRQPVEFVVAGAAPGSLDARLAAAASRTANVDPRDVPDLVRWAHLGLSVCRSDVGASRLGAMPTKIAEFLATGRPVVVNDGLGDASRLLLEHRSGAVVRDGGPADLARVADEVERLFRDDATPARCRHLAETHFDLRSGVRRLARVYRSLAANGGHTRAVASPSRRG
jgi:glycosyltransferase involved in cell wall biosynthesis